MNRRLRFLLSCLIALALLAGALAVAMRMQANRDRLNRQLLAAVVEGRPGEVRAILFEGADPNTRVEAPSAPRGFWNRLHSLLFGKDRSSYAQPTVLILAADAGDSLVVDQLLHGGADPNLVEGGDGTALMFACMAENSRAAELLVGAGANVNAKDKDGVPPIQRAAVYGRDDTVAILLAHGADANAQSKDGATALMFASREGHGEIVTKLLKSGADPNVQDADGYTALKWAVGNQKKAIRRELLRAGAKR